MQSHRELDVWKLAMELARDVYKLAPIMPKQEEYRLTGQMIRAAVSIAANIAEGHARATRKDYAHFVSIARGSAAELETLLLLAGDAELLPRDTTKAALEKADRVARMPTRLHARLKESQE
ncbi:MAG TPA: four helix bundle protein [Terricaulis sp.]|nr:four helix bundle protein [Terricaulis sp.]